MSEPINEEQVIEVVQKKKKWLIPVIIVGAATVILAIVAAVVIFSVISVTAPKRKLQKQLDLGEKYLSELDYENAILAYREAIRIDPKSEPAYLGLSHVYETMADNYHNQNDLDKAIENLDEAIKVLNDGYNETASEVIKNEKERIEKKKEEFEEEASDVSYYSISVEEAPPGLDSFLSNLYYICRNYDCNSEESQTSVAYSVMFIGYDYMQHEEIYSDDLTEWYYLYEPAEVEWVLKNVFNVSDEVLSKVREEYLTADGKYRVDKYGIGGPEWYTTAKAIETNGKLYRVTFEDSFEYDEIDSATYYALLEYKNVDGRGFWSVYKISEKNFFEENTGKSGEGEKTEWETIYATVLKNNINIIKNGANDDSDYEYVSGGIMEEAAWLDREKMLRDIGYVIMDINGDDILELLIGEHGYPGTNEQNDIVWGGYSYYYGANGGEVVFFLDGWARNQYMWIGNGLFYHEGSGSASSGSVGFARLFKDGSLLTWDDFYFFEGADVYHNNLGTYNVDQSTRATLSVEELFQLKDKYTFERLPFKPLNE